MTPTRCLLLLALTACGEKDASDSSPAADSDPAVEANTLPEGESEWEGDLEVAGNTAAFGLTLQNDGGDLEGTVAFSDELGLGSYTVSGTYDPGSGALALIPRDWVGSSPGIELMGMLGSYDPDTQIISGTVSDTASPTDNVLYGGPVNIRLLSSGEGTTPVGDGGASLDVGESSFTGTMYCASVERPVGGTLSYDGAGRFTASYTFAEEDLSDPYGTIEFSGVHNPSTGGLTWIPGLYDGPVNGDRNYAAFWFDGTYDAGTRTFSGSQSINLGGCVADRVTFNF